MFYNSIDSRIHRAPKPRRSSSSSSSPSENLKSHNGTSDLIVVKWLWTYMRKNILEHKQWIIRREESEQNTIDLENLNASSNVLNNRKLVGLGQCLALKWWCTLNYEHCLINLVGCRRQIVFRIAEELSALIMLLSIEKGAERQVFRNSRSGTALKKFCDWTEIDYKCLRYTCVENKWYCYWWRWW